MHEPPEPAYGDVAGSGGKCGPDGVVDLFDIFAVLDGFQGTFTAPCVSLSLDIAGADCVADGNIDLFDIFAILDAFADVDKCCVVP